MPVNLDTIVLRPERADDQAFLREVFDSTRREELAASGLPEAMWPGFLDLQFKAHQQGYRATFPKAEYLVVLLENQPVGRQVVNRSGTELLLVDIALLPGNRNQGIGTALIKRLSTEASAAGQALRLDVVKGGRAARLYQRLGFVKISESALHDRMELRWSQL